MLHLFRAPLGVGGNTARPLRCILTSQLSAAAAAPAAATATAAAAAAAPENLMLESCAAASCPNPRCLHCLPLGAARYLSSSSSSSNSSSSSSSSSSSKWHASLGRRSRSRDYDPPLRSEFAAAERRERMLRSPSTTGGWSVSWTPYKPPERAAAAPAAAAAAGAAAAAAAKDPENRLGL
ncbi:hypothetical protein, conserved [Eimeria acervulina]|uniref:Uncharacterized protein n=1 Tax=Eimeria acervulina TaxID=5801 RepID=U6GS65_EIMAC|nr:hypothetical protein, conserved [Eimeria acervulina]CDI81449.1 hypothetical protein, conserved [Eimeria acervulina]